MKIPMHLLFLFVFYELLFGVILLDFFNVLNGGDAKLVLLNLFCGFFLIGTISSLVSMTKSTEPTLGRKIILTAFYIFSPLPIMLFSNLNDRTADLTTVFGCLGLLLAFVLVYGFDISFNVTKKTLFTGPLAIVSVFLSVYMWMYVWFQMLDGNFM